MASRSFGCSKFFFAMALCLVLLHSAWGQIGDQVGREKWDEVVPRTFTEPAWWGEGIAFVGNWEGLAFRIRTGRQGLEGLPVDLADRYEREHSEEAVLQLKKAGIDLVVLHFYKTGLSSDHDDIEVAKKFTFLCHRHGIRVGLYIGGTIFAETVLRDLPEAKNWVSYDENGVPLRYLDAPYRFLPDFNNPGYVNYMKSVIRLAITQLHPDLIHFDNLSLSPPPNTANTPEVNRRFRAFLLAKYPEPEQRKARFGFVDISAVTVPFWHGIPSPAAIAPILDPVMEEWIDFRCEDSAEYYGKLAEYIHALDKNVIVESNPHGISGSNTAWLAGIDHARFTTHGSAFWTEEQNEAQVTTEGILISKIRSYKLARHLRETLFSYTGPTVADAKLHSWRLLMAEAMAYNRNCIGDLGGPLDAADWPDDLLRYLHFFHEQNAHYRDTQPVADVAILRSFPSLAYDSRGPQLQTTLLEQFLIQYKIPFEIITDQDLSHLGRYRAVLLADQDSLSDDEVRLLTDYVQKGGGLVATGNTSLYTEWHRVRNDYGLSAVLHLHVGTSVPAYQESVFGSGRAVYLDAVIPKGKTAQTADLALEGNGFGAHFWSLPENSSELFKAIRFAVGAPFSAEFEGAPLTTTMELTSNADGSELVLHTLNYDLATPAPAFSATVAIPANRQVVAVRVLSPDRPDQDLRFREENSRVRFTLPQLAVYNVAVIELR
jgi:hypothetical protein